MGAHAERPLRGGTGAGLHGAEFVQLGMLQVSWCIYDHLLRASPDRRSGLCRLGAEGTDESCREHAAISKVPGERKLLIRSCTSVNFECHLTKDDGIVFAIWSGMPHVPRRIVYSILMIRK